MALAAIASGAYGLGKTLGIKPGKWISGLFGGGSHCNSAKKQKEKEIKQAIEKYLSPSDMRSLVSGMNSDVAPIPSEMAHFYIGGDDCYHKNVGSGDKRFLNRLPQVIQQKANEKQQQQQAADSGAPGMGSNSMLIIGLIGLIITVFAIKGG